MQELTVVSLENGQLIAADDSGARYLIRLGSAAVPRPLRPEPRTGGSRKTTPRQIQAYIRGGMSAADVAELTGTELADIERFEGPILAEREHMVNMALGVAVHVADGDPGQRTTFGEAIRERLEALNATGERWASWREPEGGWVVKLAFTVDDIDHDARWSFDVHRRQLVPLNPEATAISQQDAPRGRTLIPRLRVVSPTDPDTSRFDSAAFTFDDGALPRALHPAAQPAGRDAGPGGVEPFSADATRHTPAPAAPAGDQTADLLASLRQKRLAGAAAADAAAPSEDGLDDPRTAADGRGGDPGGAQTHGPTAAGDVRSSGTAVTADSGEDEGGRQQPARRRPGTPGGRRQRSSIPSWDEIVFGARTDDDPA